MLSLRRLLAVPAAALLALAALASGCSSGLPKHLEGDLYTQCRMSAVGDFVYAHPVIDQPATVIQPGTLMRIKSFNAKGVLLEDGNGDDHWLMAERDQYWDVSRLPAWITKYVDPNKPTVTPAIRKLVEAGEAKPGMWREEVILAVGWPTRIGVSGPANNLSRDAVMLDGTWRINTASKGEKLRAVYFEGNKVVKVDAN